MNISNQNIGKAIQIFGWLVVFFYTAQYGYGLYSTLSDDSVRTYALVVFLVGLLYVCLGLFIVWVGKRIQMKPENHELLRTTEIRIRLLRVNHSYRFNQAADSISSFANDHFV
jgi:hypothetical protein